VSTIVALLLLVAVALLFVAAVLAANNWDLPPGGKGPSPVAPMGRGE